MQHRVFSPILKIGLLCVLGLTSMSCKAIKDVTSALANLQKLQFKLDNVNAFRLADVDISRAAQKSQVSATDIFKLTSAFARKELPISFTLNVQAKNPNDGTGATKSTSLYLRKMAWTLLIDDRTTITGVVDKRLEIPGGGQSTIIPVAINLDLYDFFAEKGFDDLLNLGFAIGGAQGSSSRLKLTAKVAVETPFGVVDYPGELTIVNTQFTNP